MLNISVKKVISVINGTKEDFSNKYFLVFEFYDSNNENIRSK